MKKFYLLLLFASLSLCSRADWEVFKLNQLSYYTFMSTASYGSIYMDTIVHRSNYDVYLLNRKYYGYDHSSCYYSLALVDSPGVQIHLNQSFDSLLIIGDTVKFFNYGYMQFYFLPNIPVGQSWTSNAITYTHNSNSMMSIFGVMDSVRIFSQNCILSKQHGFISFPSNMSITQVQSLVGFSDQSGAYGFIKPVYTDFFPYHPGDILYWKHEDYPPMSWPNVWYQIDTIVSMTLNTDSAVINTRSFHYDNTTSVNNANQYIFYDPANMLEAPTNWFGISENNSYIRVMLSIQYDIQPDSSINYISADGGYWDCNGMQSPDVDEEYTFNTRLGYIKWKNGAFYPNSTFLTGAIINGVVWGDTTNYVGMEDVSKTSFNFYPNPAAEKLFVNTLREQHYQIMDIAGKIVLEGNVGTTKNIIDIQSLNAGIYLIRISGTVKIFIKASN